MAMTLSITKAPANKLRKLPLLPRLAFTLEVGGRQITYRHSPMLETLLNLRERGFALGKLRKLVREELGEITLPGSRPARDESAAKSPLEKASTAKAQAKSPAKAAARRKKAVIEVVVEGQDGKA